MIRRPPRSTQGVSSAASDVYKRQGLVLGWSYLVAAGCCLGAVVLAIVGLCGCRRISNKYGRVGSIMLFAFAAAAALLFGIIVVAIGMR